MAAFAPDASSSALFTFDVTRALGGQGLSPTGAAKYAPMLDDVLRMVCIQFTIQLMLYFSGAPGAARILSAEFLTLLLYVVLGVLFYWLVLRELVAFR